MTTDLGNSSFWKFFRRCSQGSADRPYNNEIVIISPNEAKSLSKGLLNLGNITKVVSNRGKAKM